MKIAIATNENSLKDEIALHFGRTKNFLIFDTEKKTFEIFSNPEISEKELPPDFLHRQGVKVIIAFSLGPRAFEKFKNYGIELYKAIEGAILENLQEFEKGKLKKLGEEDIF